MKNNEENKKIVINGNQYYNLEDVPEPFRDMITAKMETAQTDEQTPGESKTTIQKDFQFQGGPGLNALLKFLIKVAPPPKPRAPKLPNPAPIEPETDETPEVEEIFDPEEIPNPSSAYNLPKPDPIEPSASDWIIWLAAGILAAFYYFYLKK
ncbi:MAG: hypothetical protein A2270_01060 [Elusimicrobia bacterium RIFOXYA12_FULL_51_18]|nr:MAG: hypothetical protein A2270_01060 [Elusimicrobia bacterium RIFOXYA12_FULL_51_18]OGS31106.1 MAG: hypothetical protein A2218_02075 [Elusimicrobia bacterium RIFOXYA2_FULL_53_38]